MTKLEAELMSRAVIALEQLAENVRIIAQPTQDEVRQRLEQSLAMATLLDSTKPHDEMFN